MADPACPRGLARALPLLLTCALAAPARALEPYQPPEELRRPAVLPDAASAGDARVLSLAAAIQIAAAQNLGIRLQRELAASAVLGIRGALGRFEPSLQALYAYRDATSPPAIDLVQQGVPLVSLTTVSNQWSLGLSERLPTGAQLTLSFNNASARTNTQQSPLLYNTGLTLQVSQPLLRGFGFDLDLPRAELLRARLSAERAGRDVRAALQAAVRATEDAYWDLVQAIKAHEIQRGSVALASQQLRLTQRQIDAGILPPSDLIAAESTQAQRELGLLQADAAVGLASDRLRAVLNLPREEWGRPLLPGDPPPPFVEAHLDLEQATEVALRNRPEIARRRLDLSRAELDLRVARNDRLPQLDVGASYGLVGQRQSYQDALGQLASRAGPAWSLFASFSWAPLMVASRAQAAAQEAAQRSAQVQLAQQQLDLTLELRDALRALDSAAREVRAAAKFREFAQRSLDAEQRRFLGGDSTNFVIAQRQAEVMQARQSELSAVIRHHKAATALSAAMGVLLEERGVQLD